MKSFDPVSLGIMWDRLISITDEIVQTLVRTSFSSIVRESYDLSCVLFDEDGGMLAQGRYSVPVFIGTAPYTMKAILERYPAESLSPGDVILTNDPWIGTGHLWDVNVVRPAFRRGKLVGFALSITHLPDIGGRGFSAVSETIYEEGLQLPICKLVKEGRINEELIEIIRKNVRVPTQVIGDLMANVSATELGCRQLVEFMDEYGLDDLRPLCKAISAQSERAMRREIAKVPDGIYRHSFDIKLFRDPVRLCCAVTVAGDRLTIDFAGTGGPVRAATNVPLCYTRAWAIYAAKCLLLPAIPNNEGSVNPIEVTAPTDCILNVQAPHATGARGQVGHFVVPLVFGALGQALPDRTPAESGMVNTINFIGRTKGGRDFTNVFFSSGGFGAIGGKDGPPALPMPTNISVMPTEVWETMTNMTVEYRSLRPDSGGAGEYRGGVGQDMVFRNDTGHPLTVFLLGMRADQAARGQVGGGDGAKRTYRINGDIVHPKGQYKLQPGDTIECNDAGGGGHGEPKLRSLASLQADIDEGLVSRDAVQKDYGIDLGSLT